MLFWKKTRWLLILAAAASTGALAGPPFLTDDPQVVDFRHWEVITGTQIFRSPGSWSATIPQTEINYGIIPDLQLHVMVQNNFLATEGAPQVGGTGDTEIGTKYHLLTQTEDLPDITIYPLIALPTASTSRGLGSDHVQLNLPIWFEKDFGKWTTYGGAGYWTNPGPENENWYYMGWQVQRQLTDHFALGAEIFYQSAQTQFGSSNTFLDVGSIWDLNETVHVLTSIGHTVQGTPGYEGFLALQFTFGPK